MSISSFVFLGSVVEGYSESRKRGNYYYYYSSPFWGFYSIVGLLDILGDKTANEGVTLKLGFYWAEVEAFVFFCYIFFGFWIDWDSVAIIVVGNWRVFN